MYCWLAKLVFWPHIYSPKFIQHIQALNINRCLVDCNRLDEAVRLCKISITIQCFAIHGEKKQQFKKTSIITLFLTH